MAASLMEKSGFQNPESPATFDFVGEQFADIAEYLINKCSIVVVQMQNDQKPQTYLKIPQNAFASTRDILSDNIRKSVTTSLKVSKHGNEIKQNVLIATLQDEISHIDLDEVVDDLIKKKIDFSSTPYYALSTISGSTFSEIPKLIDIDDQDKAEKGYDQFYKTSLGFEYTEIRSNQQLFRQAVCDNLASFNREIMPSDIKENILRSFQIDFHVMESVLADLQSYLNDANDITPLLKSLFHNCKDLENFDFPVYISSFANISNLLFDILDKSPHNDVAGERFYNTNDETGGFLAELLNIYDQNKIFANVGDWRTLTAIPQENESPESTNQRTNKMLKILKRKFEKLEKEDVEIEEKITANFTQQKLCESMQAAAKDTLAKTKSGTVEYFWANLANIKHSGTMNKLKINLAKLKNRHSEIKTKIKNIDNERIIKEIYSKMERYYGVSEL